MAPPYAETEAQYYSWIFLLCDLNRDGVIDVENDKPWLQNSGLETDVVDQVCGTTPIVLCCEMRAPDVVSIAVCFGC